MLQFKPVFVHCRRICRSDILRRYETENDVASIFFDKKAKRWKAEIHVDGQRGPGKRFRTETEAKAWAAETETELRKGTYVDLAAARKMTLADVLQEYKKTELPKRRTQSSREAEYYRINKILTYDIVKKSLAKLTKTDVDRFKEQRRAIPSRNGGIVSDGSIAREIDILRSAIAYACDVLHIELKENVFVISRFSHKKKLKKTKRDRVFVDNEKQIFINEIKKCRNKQYFTWFEFVLETGLRKAESVAIKWKDWKRPEPLLYVKRVEDKQPSPKFAKEFNIEVEASKERVFVDGTKNSKSQYIPLSPRAEEILEGLRKHKKSRTELVFDQITYSSLTSQWRRIQKIVGDMEVEDFHLHDLRHVAITNIAAVLDNAYEVKTAARHSDIGQTDGYVHSDVLLIAAKLRYAHERKLAAVKKKTEDKPV